ncbi:putative ABC transporter periplasmatic binding protein [Octadecabacter antarcticus 307]|uniref:Putative ABC transporter periplasmatic binding protein n=1 Tax=Octadecabacter antarcticus 307 TaxID=391626 RepID=M9R5N8_9RHOB|nr:ABC transporter substrate-binding protein [Octadecabacter antarcticus]AGI67522.1 putative ABC transporter periplasmatic binding protein [Octadecabacter antarcticus 307]
MKLKLFAAMTINMVATTTLADSHTETVVFGTNWLAQAEHGGFYQSVADGTYAACGLDVEILPGGPQVNNRALMLAGKMDFHMGGDMLQAFNAVQQGIPVVVVGATFQKHPQVIIAHPGKAETFEDLKNLTLLIGDNGFTSYYQWMINEYGFTAEQREPYTFNAAPFLADETKGMQGFLSSEPYAIEKTTGMKPDVFLIADAGFSSYATTIETMADTIATRPDAVSCFVEGSAKGWYNFLYGENAGARQLILEANPDMTADKIDFAIMMMTENGIVDSGDALETGIMTINPDVISDFYDKMVEAGVIESGIDILTAYTTDFVNNGVGMDLKPTN